MHLRQVRISGFKSFAGPTVIEFPGSFVGIVGPNGCGKSNVIDAVRWVMGEGRAGELRATSSMAELIFAGASGRAPAGRASVEMVLDNSDGTLAGPWGGYAEISIRRTLTREGASAYQINGQTVRRRDVQDIFMGTGLGPRSYAIISQGTISGFIKAKPEEMRGYFEEAAGISRYKERRKEAASRLEATRGNLSRAEDAQALRREEIGRLSSDAEVAQKWQQLEDRKNDLAGMWLALQEESARDRSDRMAARIAESEAETESIRAEQASAARTQAELELQLSEARSTENSRRDAYSSLMLQAARMQGEIASLTERKKMLKQRISRDEEKLRRIAELRDELAVQTEQLEEEAASQEETAAELDAAAEEASARAEEIREELEKARTAQKTASQQEQQAQKLLTETGFREQMLGKERRELEEKIQKLQTESEQPGGPQQADLERAREEQAERSAVLEECAELQQQAQDALREAEEALREAENEKAASAEKLSGLRGRIAVLQDVQKKSGAGDKQKTWLMQHGLSSVPAAMSLVKVEKGWEKAAEAALSVRAAALEVPSLQSVLSFEKDPPAARQAFYESFSAKEAETPPAGSLAWKIAGENAAALQAVRRWLSPYTAAETLEEALEFSARHPDAVCITRDGHSAAAGSILFWAEDAPGAGFFSRAAELEELSREKDLTENRCTASLEAVAEASERRDQAVSAGKAADSRLERARNDHYSASVRVSGLEAEAQAQLRRKNQISEELAELSERLEENAAETEEVLQQFDERDAALSELSQKAQDAEMRLEAVQNALDEALSASRDASSRRQLAETKRRYASERAAAVRQAVLKNEADEAELIASAEEARAGLEELETEAKEHDLEGVLQQQDAAEAVLREAQEATAALTQRFSDNAKTLSALSERERPLLERTGDLKARLGRLENELQALQLQIAERELDVPRMLQKAHEEKRDAASARSEIERLETEISSLGPVNHAALEHLAAARRALEATDRQIEDLNAAVATLEEAIRKIDSETRAVLKETIGRVNENFGNVFQKIFGGGSAALEITGDDILEAGVEIRAHPPGKRNASVKLLSGGEQALTATALVFALFGLNPAPFCLLDEVDAPLDETNQLRLARLIEEMSRSTQFVAITHHRIMMEVAAQLIGVTMREPGVSRVVSVDLTEAVEYAASSQASQ